MPTSVVTGGAGFLGSHLCEALLGEGHRVICVDNLETGSLANIEHLRDDAFAFAPPRRDRAHRGSTSRSTSSTTSRALASPIDYLRLPLHSLKVGSYGTHNALGLAKFKRARFLLASTSEVYGDPQVHPQPETYWGHVNPIGPRGVYDEAKRYAEALTMAYHRQQGVDTAIVRIFNTYGPRMRPHDGRAIPTFVRQALEREAAHRLRRRLADAELLLRRRPDPRPRSCSPSAASTCRSTSATRGEFTLLELAEAVLAATGSSSEIVFEALPVDDPQVRQPDITRARQLLGWEPEIELDEGLRRMLASLGRRPGACVGRLAARRRRSLVAARSRRSRRARRRRRRSSIGIFDDGEVLYGDPDQVFPQLQPRPGRRCSASTSGGAGPGSASRRASRSARPTRTTRPTTGTRTTARCGSRSPTSIQPIFSIIGTPPWANAAKGWNVAPTNALDLQSFARRGAERYSGTFVNADGVTLPRVQPVDGLERAEQPGLPEAAVPSRRARPG